MGLPAVTIPRIEEMLDSMGLGHQTDDDEIVIGFDNALVFLFLFSDINLMEISAMWGSKILKEDHESAAHLCMTLNEQLYLPKMCYLVDAGDSMTIVAKHAMPIGAGMTDEQLEDCIRATFAHEFSAIEKFEETFPHVAVGNSGSGA